MISLLHMHGTMHDFPNKQVSLNERDLNGVKVHAWKVPKDVKDKQEWLWNNLNYKTKGQREHKTKNKRTNN